MVRRKKREEEVIRMGWTYFTLGIVLGIALFVILFSLTELIRTLLSR